jgi:phosphoesterase RecJ-like protein
MDLEKIKELAKILKEKDNFVLASHLRYDPDALGSLVSLGLILKKLNKNFFIYFEEELGSEHQFITLQDKFTKNLGQDFDIAIVVDCDKLLLPGERFYSNLKGKFTILIDTHQTNAKDANLNVVMETNSNAAVEIIYYLTKELGLDFDQDLATAILLGILGDTLILTSELSREKYVKVFEIIKELVEKGGDYYLVVDAIKSKDWAKFKNEIETLTKANLEGDILWVIVENENVKQSSIADNLLRVREAKVIVVFKRVDNKTLISLRSKGNIDVAYLAKEYFNGGGHKNAAGGFLEMDIDSAKNFVLEKLKEYLNKLV